MKHWIGLAAGVILGFSAFLLMPETAEAAEPETARDGIYIEDIDVSGMNREEISQAVQQKLAELQQDTVQLMVNGTAVTVSAGELGLALEDSDVVDKALEAGQKEMCWSASAWRNIWRSGGLRSGDGSVRGRGHGPECCGK